MHYGANYILYRPFSLPKNVGSTLTLGGDVTVNLKESDDNSLVIGNNNIFFDLKTTKLKTDCPKCGKPADESMAEEKINYKASWEKYRILLSAWQKSN